VIFCGSKILKSYTLLDSEIEADGIVFQTGFNTLKGQVTRNILYPKNVMFKHEKESYKYLFSLFGFSITMLITYYIYAFLINRPSSSTFYIVLAGADIIFTAFPPGLPLCLIVGISFATKRLKEMKVDCLKPSLINAAGRIKTFCFDKTGTLTKTSMNFTGLSILDSSKNYFSLISLDNELEFVNLDEEIDNPGLQKCPRDIFYGMGTCHTINIVKNEVLGDSMELEIFKFS